MVLTINEREQQQANVAAFPIARFAMTQLSKKSRLSVKDFLPYPDEGKDNKEGVRAETVAVLRRLIKRRVLPARVEAAAIRSIGGLDG